MSDFDFNNIENLKAEEKRLYDEYKAKLAELKKVQKEKVKRITKDEKKWYLFFLKKLNIFYTSKYVKRIHDISNKPNYYNNN